MANKIPIIIASLLKPVDDTRAYEKMGLSLAQTNKYDVNIIGFETKKKSKHANIYFHHIFNSHRKSFSRLIARYKFLNICFKLKPELIIVNTPELLLVSYLYKIIFGNKLVYDIRENYKMNITQNSVYSKLEKPFLKSYLYLVEKTSRAFVDHYFLAEKVYKNQLSFIKNKNYTILENKSVLKERKTESVFYPKEKAINYIISGTLGSEYGTLEGIQFFHEIKKIQAESKLLIIGYSADQAYRQKLIEYCRNDNAIQLITGLSPIPQEDIIKQIKASDIAILPYIINDNLKYRIPTKIYDYIALSIPMIISENECWQDLLTKYNAGISVDFKHYEPAVVVRKMTGHYFFENTEAKDIFWDSEEEKFIKVINSLI